ncbi:MAG: flagellar hook-basal body complex protein [Solirubrobacteraceae bacterium]|nr:flagellar hook-basal body complex protein [Solirubrobacteraceae bacterium]
MYSAISGLKTHQIMLDVTANDLANVNTVGFKASRATFRDALAQTQRAGAAANTGSGGYNAAQVGLGVTLGSIDNLMNSGAFQSTGSALDVALQGDGWFRVGTGVPTAGAPDTGVPAVNDLNYTRAGNFTRNDQGYMITQDGYYVMGKVGPDSDGDTATTVADCFIAIPPGATDVAIGADGAVSFVPPAGFTQPAVLPPIGADGRAVAGYLSVAKFGNEAGLQRVTSNRWTSTPQAGGEVAGTPGNAYGQSIGGVLEMSNVDMASEFTNMITAQRGFQANSRVISTSDEMLQDLVNLKR